MSAHHNQFLFSFAEHSVVSGPYTVRIVQLATHGRSGSGANPTSQAPPIVPSSNWCCRHRHGAAFRVCGIPAHAAGAALRDVANHGRIRQQNVQFDTDDLSYNLLDLSIRFRNLRIRAQDAPDLPLFTEIDEARLDLSLTQLLRKRYVLQDGEARGVRVHYYVGETGRDNLPRPLAIPNSPASRSTISSISSRSWARACDMRIEPRISICRCRCRRW